MTAKAIKGKGCRGALEYDLSKEQGRAIDTNMEGAGPREPECFGTACVVLTLRYGAGTGIE
jgi:hypothetical protein